MTSRALATARPLRLVVGILAALAIALLLVLMSATAGQAAPGDPVPPGGGGVSVEINGPDGTPSFSIVTLIGITLLSVAPALLLMMTSFTKIFVVLAMARNALALPSIPPNQVLAGLALFLSPVHHGAGGLRT